MKLIAYLIFNGDCRQAFELYSKVLDAPIGMISTYGESPENEKLKPEDRDRIIHVRLDGQGWQLMGSDAHPNMPYKGIEGCSISIDVASAAEAERVFKALAEGGQVTMPLDKTFFAERFGMLKDRFGASWMVNFAQPK